MITDKKKVNVYKLPIKINKLTSILNPKIDSKLQILKKVLGSTIDPILIFLPNYKKLEKTLENTAQNKSVLDMAIATDQ